MFESNGWSEVSRTWEWVGGAWSLRRTGATPVARRLFGLGYDPWRQRIVLFGGTTDQDHWLPGAWLHDTWEYDGERWTLRAPLASPPPQLVSWLGADHANNQLLMCGVSPQPGAPTWLYDGATWTASASLPFPSTAGGVATDPLRQRIVALSTQQFWGGGTVPATYEWDGTTWTQSTSAVHPPLSSCLAYDPSRATVVLHVAGTLWEWDGVAWSTVNAPPTSAFECQAMAHDAGRGRLVMFGVTAGYYDRSTLEWDGAVWHPHAATANPNAELDTTWFDPNRGRVVAFPSTESAWFEWDGNAWQRHSVPTGGGGFYFAFDEARSRTVALQWSQASGWQTAEWDGTTWSAPIALAPPSPGPLVYHAGRGRVMTVAGAAGIWEWDGVSWSGLGAATSAPWATSFVDLAYDAARNELVACVGHVFSPPSTSTWDGVAWTQHAPATSPPPRVEFSLEYDPIRQRVVLFGGRDRLGPNNSWVYHGDLWEWDGTTWSERASIQQPAGRILAGLVFEPTNGELMLTGGMRADSSIPRFTDVWLLDDEPTASVTRLGPGCGSGNNTPRLTPSHPYPTAPAFTLDVDGAPANSPTLLTFALAPRRAVVAGNCVSYVPSPYLVTLAVANGHGFASVGAAIPAGMIGRSFAVQAAILDPASSVGVALTEGIRITIGH